MLDGGSHIFGKLHGVLCQLKRQNIASMADNMQQKGSTPVNSGHLPTICQPSAMHERTLTSALQVVGGWPTSRIEHATIGRDAAADCCEQVLSLAVKISCACVSHDQ